MHNNVKKKKAHIGWQVYIGRHETQVLLKKRMREQSHSKNDIVLIGQRKRTSAHHAMLSQYPFHITKGKILSGSCILKNTDANIYIYIYIYIMQQLQILAIKNYHTGKGYMWLVRQPSHSIF
jgi:hypothetical protein